MVLKIFGGLSLIVGLFLLIGGPSDRGQIPAYGNTARLLGIILIGIGIVLLKW
jgi:hypothetical protein